MSTVFANGQSEHKMLVTYETAARKFVDVLFLSLNMKSIFRRTDRLVECHRNSSDFPRAVWVASNRLNAITIPVWLKILGETTAKSYSSGKIVLTT